MTKTYTKSQLLMMLLARRGRGFSPLVALLLLCIPIIFVTIVLPLTVKTETWYVVTMDTTFISIFVIWRFIVGIGPAIEKMGARSNIGRLLSGDHLIHWQYEPEEWQQFVESEYARDRMISTGFTSLRQGILGAVIFGGLVTAMMVLVNIDEGSKPGGRPPYTLQILASTVGFAIALPLVITIAQITSLYLGDRKADRQRRRHIPEIYLNREGVYGLPSGYMALPLRTIPYVDADEPSILKIEVTKMISTKGGRYPQIKVERILIPSGKEDEARQAVVRFGARH